MPPAAPRSLSSPPPVTSSDYGVVLAKLLAGQAELAAKLDRLAEMVASQQHQSTAEFAKQATSIAALTSQLNQSSLNLQAAIQKIPVIKERTVPLDLPKATSPTSFAAVAARQAPKAATRPAQVRDEMPFTTVTRNRGKEASHEAPRPAPMPRPTAPMHRPSAFSVLDDTAPPPSPGKRTYQKLNEDELQRALSGLNPNKPRHVRSLYVTGFRANRISVVKQILAGNCAIDLRQVPNIDFIGKQLAEFHVYEGYTEEFQTKLLAVVPDVAFVQVDPLDPALFKAESRGGPKDAAKKVIDRLSPRLKSSPTTAHKRYLRQLLYDAHAQLSSGRYRQEVPAPEAMLIDLSEPNAPRNSVTSGLSDEELCRNIADSKSLMTKQAYAGQQDILRRHVAKNLAELLRRTPEIQQAVDLTPAPEHELVDRLEATLDMLEDTELAPARRDMLVRIVGILDGELGMRLPVLTVPEVATATEGTLQ